MQTLRASPALHASSAARCRAAAGTRAGMRHATLPAPARVSAPAARRSTRAASTKQQFSSFEEMLAGSEVPLLVDFYATWCGPCQMLSPILSSVQTKLEGKIKVVKIDSEKYPGLSTKYRVQALPTIILFKGGEPVDRIEGLPNEAQLMDRLKYFI